MAENKKKEQPKKHEQPLKVNGDFLDVFKVVKKNKEENQKKKKS